MHALARGAISLLAAGQPFHHGVNGLEMARVGGERDGDVARGRVSAALGAEVVLDVAAGAGPCRQGCEGPLALELAQDRLVRPAEHMGEDVEPSAVGHPDHELVRTVLRGELDRSVEHRDERVQALDRERLLAQECAPEIPLEALDLRETRQQAALLVCRERRSVRAGLDRLAQPDALLVVGDVLDLVCARAGVRLLQLRKHVRQGLPGEVHAEELRGNLPLELQRQRRNEALRLERRVSHRLRAEGIEPRGEVAVRAVSLHESHGCGDGAEKLLVGDRGRRRLGLDRHLRRRGDDGRGLAVLGGP